ncbi:MAG: hypothetical protein JKX94_03845 [Sneathiella sp.]|nr:hypothetical protein [Sneathiella sp.]
MQEGLYKTAFETPFGSGLGVMVLRNGKAHGGNSALFYVGDYSLNDTHWEARIITRRHSLDLNMASVFGLDLVHVTMNGQVNGKEITIKGVADEVPDMEMHGKLTFLCD